jgi:DMSO/TMAO reductase YedYZ molybdopterin-dependent catalytic subunit
MPQNDSATRRGFLRKVALAAGSAALAGCDRLGATPWFRDLLGSAERLTEAAQRSLLSADDLAREYTEADLSPSFRANGSTMPADPTYRSMAANRFADWRLAVDGLVEKPATFSLAELRKMPSRTQITRHDCVEGWSCIGKWTGVPLGHVLGEARLGRQARYIVFHCADTLQPTFGDSGQYYESIGLDDAFHAQTILAYEMNGETLPIPHGAPIRLRVERQLGYKMAKYVMRIEAVASLESIRGGRGGYWEDRGYEWYAGI